MMATLMPVWDLTENLSTIRTHYDEVSKIDPMSGALG